MLFLRESRPSTGFVCLRSWFTIQTSIRLAIWLNSVFSASAIFHRRLTVGLMIPRSTRLIIRAVEPALAAEALLRVARPFAEFAHYDPNSFRFQIGRLDLPLAPLHGQIRWW
jgi:hypothetical protein